MAEEARTDWESYPVGLKVLAVDDDPLCLKVVEQMLRRCNYEVKTADNGKDALAKLRERDSQIDLVLSDVYMPDMDGFKLLETIALELDVPVIMMSSNGETPVVLRGVTHGAVDFLIKPVRIEELRNVWQHVVRRKSHQGSHPSREYSGEDEAAEGNRVDKKRKEAQAQMQHEVDENTSAKKPRVVWSVEMHQQFVNAVNSLGIDKAVPKRILDQMNVEGLTRENVASHLQKYRLYLKRVSGVQVQSGIRSKSLRENSLEGNPYHAMMMPSQNSSGSGLRLQADGNSEQEDLKLRLQMRQLQNEQQAMADQRLKEEVAMPGHLNPMPFKTEPGYDSNIARPTYGAVPQALTRIPSLTRGGALPVEELPGSNLVPIRGSGTYDASHMIYPTQDYGTSDMHAITRGDLVYPDPIMHTNLHEMHINPQGYHIPQPSLQNPTFSSSEGHRNGQSEQDMERFIDIFLQPNE